jgi:phosphate:Na+ symporter
MIASFVERDLVAPAMAQIVLLGANVGTAVTAWIVSTGIEWISPLLILVGIVFYRRASTTAKGIGTAIVGVGLMLLSLHLLSLATEPVRHSPALGAFIQPLDNAWVVAMLFAAALAALSSSGLTAVMLIVPLAAAGALSPGLTVALILGANLGGALPLVLSTLSAPAIARRVTIGNLLV